MDFLLFSGICRLTLGLVILKRVHGLDTWKQGGAKIGGPGVLATHLPRCVWLNYVPLNVVRKSTSQPTGLHGRSSLFENTAEDLNTTDQLTQLTVKSQNFLWYLISYYCIFIITPREIFLALTPSKFNISLFLACRK